MTLRRFSKQHVPLAGAEVMRAALNAVNGSTALGLAVAAAARTRVSKGPRGLIIAAGYRWRLPFASAFTLGNVVLCRCTAGELLDRPVLLAHEEKHSTQYAWCLGLPFLPMYFLAAAWSLLRTGNPGTGNPFERQAGLSAGGYPAGRSARGPGTGGSTQSRVEDRNRDA